jgi:SAM-dependent methyltransferase
VKLATLLAAPGLVVRSGLAARRGRQATIPGGDFDRFGRRLGARLLFSGKPRLGAPLLLNPVSIVRYFEFPFVAAAVPDGARVCADLSSPALFSLFWASTHPNVAIEMINPDGSDLDQTRRIAAATGTRLSFRHSDARILLDRPATYDSMWAISVLEHISGEYDDSEAIGWMYRALKPGGAMAVTVPVDRQFHDEYRDTDPYRLVQPVGSRVFFQRWYDLAAIRQRLLDRLPGAETRMAFFGETQPGAFAAYEEEWKRLGLRASVDDPRVVADSMTAYPDWESMPGAGVCGIRVAKPQCAG